jgi:ATP-dependent Clp protease adaptor protein ClpS
MKLAAQLALLIAAFAATGVEGFARPASLLARSAVHSLQRSPVTMSDVLTRPPDIKLTPAKPSNDQQNDKGKKFKVLLFNDAVNKREFVARILTGTIPEMTEPKAYTVMQKAHTNGFAVCGVWVFELAEAYCDGLTVRARRASLHNPCLRVGIRVGRVGIRRLTLPRYRAPHPPIHPPPCCAPELRASRPRVLPLLSPRSRMSESRRVALRLAR